jgi:hypothetical protein
MSSWHHADDPLQALHGDKTGEVTTVGAQRPVSREGSDEIGGRPGSTKKNSSIFLEDGEFVDQVVRRLDRQAHSTPRCSIERAGGVSIHCGSPSTPRTPSLNAARDPETPSSPSKSKRSLRRLNTKSFGEDQRHRHPRSLFTLLGGLDANFDSFDLSLSRGIRQPSKKLENQPDPRREDYPANRPDSAVTTGRAADASITTWVNSASNSVFSALSPRPEELADDDSNDCMGLSKLNLRSGGYGIGGKVMYKSSSAPALAKAPQVKGGDPIILAKRTTAIAAAATRSGCSRSRKNGTESKGQSYSAAIAVKGNGSKPILEEAPEMTNNMEVYRSGSAPGGPKRRRATTDQVSSLLGFSADQLALDAGCAQPRAATAQGLPGMGTGREWLGSSNASRLASPASMPSLLCSRTFNYFTVKDQYRPKTSCDQFETSMFL